MPARRRNVATCLVLLGLSKTPAFAREEAEAPRPPSATAPAGVLGPEPCPGPGRPDEPAEATIAPTAEQAAQTEEADTRALAKLLGLDDAPVTLYGWLQNSFTGTPGIDPRDRSTVTVFP